MAEPEEQNLPADGQSHALQTTAQSEVLCGASPYSAGADEVRAQTHMYEQRALQKRKCISFEEVVDENISSPSVSRDVFRLPFNTVQHVRETAVRNTTEHVGV